MYWFLPIAVPGQCCHGVCLLLCFPSFSIMLKITLIENFDLDLGCLKEGSIYNQRGTGFHLCRQMHVLEHSLLRCPECNLLDPLWIVNFWSWAPFFFLSAEESFMITLHYLV